MDLLFHRYASPMDLMKLYIEQERFGEFVNDVITAENKRRKEQAEKEEDDKLWLAYLQYLRYDTQYSTFSDWKAAVMKPVSPNSNGKRDDDMTKADVDNLLNRLFPEQ